MVKNKYNRKKITVDGYKFDSKAEADYYRFLKKEKEAGNILEIELQPKIVLQPGFRLKGKLIRQISYTPDFLVTWKLGGKVYIDVKGVSTQQGELRYKMYKYKHERKGGIPLIWVSPSKKYSLSGWIEYFRLHQIRLLNRKNGKGWI